MQQSENNHYPKNPHSQQPSIQKTIDLILKHHVEGRLLKAQELFQEALRADTESFETLHMLGVTAMQIGYNEQALNLISKAIKINPNFAEAHNNLALAYHALGRVDDAIDSFRDAIKTNSQFVDPYNLLGCVLIELGRSRDAITYLKQAVSLDQGYAFAHFNLANAYMHIGEYEGAIASYIGAIKANPDFIDAHYNLGNAYMHVGKFEEAEVSYIKVVAARPDSAEACYNMGTVQFHLGKLENAVISYQNTLTNKPDYFEAYNNQAIALKELDRLSEAEAVLETVIQLNPDYADAYKNLAIILIELERFEDAIKNLNKSMLLRPKDAEVYINLGLAYEDTDRFEEAIANYKIALNINPELYFVHMNLGNAYKKNGDFLSAITSYEIYIAIDPGDVEGYTKLGSVQRSLNRIDEAIQNFKKALEIQPDFLKALKDLGNTYHRLGRMDEVVKSCREINRIAPEDTQNHSTLIFSLGHTPEITGEDILKEARRWDTMHGVKDTIAEYNNNPDPNRRMRVGYVSADFRNHAAALFMEPLLFEHNRDEVEVFCYAEVKDPDYVTERIQSSVDHWRSTVGLNDNEMNARILNDEIDIIIECSGRTNDNRLIAISRKPAPIQVNYFPMHGQTSGMASMDYALSDLTLSPPEFYDQFSEKIINIESGAFTFHPNSEWPEVAPPRGPEDDLVFACVGDPARIGETTIDLWARLLDLVPEAKLLFKHPNYDNPYVLEKWQEKFKRLGDRILFDGVIGGWGVHMDTYGKIDVVLDTIPMAGGTSCAIPLWMGVPVVTMSSQYVGHRVAMSVLKNSGFPEFIAEDGDDYLRITTELIYDRDRLAKLRKKLREKVNAAPICNFKAHAKDIEGAYRTMWKRWCAAEGNL